MKKIFLLTLCFWQCAVFSQQYSKVEYFVDSDPGYGLGTSAPLPVGDSSVFVADLSQQSSGFHILYVRVQDTAKHWSQTMSRPFLKQAIVSTAITTVTLAEYFIDNDPGFGKGTTVNNISNNTISFIADLSSIPAGFHILYVRSQDNYGRWSEIQSRPFLKQAIQSSSLATIVSAEYFIDTDPGFGKAQSISPSLIGSAVEIDFLANLSSISIGTHKLSIRAKDSNGNWSMVQTQDFCYGAVANFALSDSVVCTEGFIQITNKTVGASAGTTYSWDFNGDNTIDYSGKNNSTWFFDTPGSYTASLTVTEAGGLCPNTYKRTVVISKPEVSISAPTIKELYVNESLPIKASVINVSNHHTMKWTTTGGIVSNDTAKTTIFSSSQPGNFTLTATVTDIVGCTGSKTFTKKILPLIENFIIKDTISAFKSKQNKIATQYLSASNKVVWESLNTGIATVSSVGMITCVANGETIVRGTVDGLYTDSILIQVKDYIPITSVIVQQSAGLSVGGNGLENYVRILPTNASIQTVTWHTSDSSVAKVSKTGTITPINAGTCNIIVIADDGNIPAVTFVTVNSGQIDVQKVLVSDTIYAKVGETVQIKASVVPYYASNDTLQWSSMKPTVASVDDKGTITAVASGQAYILISPAQGTQAKTLVIVRSSNIPVLSTPTTVSYYLENPTWQLDLNSVMSDDNTTNQNLKVNVTGTVNLNAIVGTDKKITFTSKETDWIGSEVVTITITDADGLKTSKALEVVVSGTPNQAPQLYFPAVSQTSAQAVSLALADYVTDDRDALSALTITAQSKGTCTVTVTSAQLTITPKSTTWKGIDTITIIAKDSKGATSIQKISFSVSAQQTATAPQIQPIPVQYSNSFGQFADVTLNRYVKDAATLPENMYWETAPSFKLDVRITKNILSATPVDINWVGSERIKAYVVNQAGLRDSVEIIFIKQNTQDVVWEGSATIDFFAERTIANRGSNITLYPNMTGARSWKWIITGAGETITSQALYPNINFAKNGVYDVSLVCQSKTNKDTLTAHNYISIFGITPGDTTICLSAKVKLSINTAGLDSWKWSDGTTDNMITVAPTKTQYYKVHVSKDLFEYDDSVKVTVIQPFKFKNKISEICKGDVVTLTTGVYSKYIWNDGSDMSSHNIDPFNSKKYSVTVTDLYGCISSDSIDIKDVKSLPTITLVNDTNICKGSSFYLYAPTSNAYKWNDGSIAKSISVNKAGIYTVTITGSNGCLNSDTTNVKMLFPYKEQIGVVTYDTLFGKKVIIAWNRHENMRTESYELYRDNGSDGWDLVKKLKFSDPAIVVDSTANLDLKAYRYKLTTIDETCHNQDSSIHRTMHVSPLNRPDGGINIQWNSYLGFNVKSYTVVRYNLDGTETLIAKQSGDADILTVTDFKPVLGSRYRVLYNLPDSVFPLKTKSDSGPFSVSLSNMAESELVGINSEDSKSVSLSPNPASDFVTITSTSQQDILVKVLDVLGQELIIQTGNGSVKIDCTILKPGIYYVKIQDGDVISTQSVVVE